MPAYPQMPLTGVRIKNSAGTLYLNAAPTGAIYPSDGIRWQSILPGGYDSAEFRVSGSEKTLHSTFYSYGAQVTLFNAENAFNAGVLRDANIVWDGYLKTPEPNQDSTWTMRCVGWYTLLEEKEQPILWREESYDEWVEGGSEPFDSGSYKPHDSVNISIKKAGIRFSIGKGQDAKAANDPDAADWGTNKITGARAMWSYEGVQVYRVESDIENDKIPGGSTTPRYTLKLQRGDYGDDTTVNQLGNVADYQGALTTKGTNTRQTLLDVPRDVIGFYFFRTTNSVVSTAEPFSVRIQRVVISGDGYRNASTYLVNNTNWDTYASNQAVLDIADRMGVLGVTTTQGLCPASGDNCLPLFFTDGTWFDLMEELAGKSFKWAMWIDGAFEFRPWSSATTYKAKGFGAGAHAIVDLASTDDIYHGVKVSYRYKGRKKRRFYPANGYLSTGVTPPTGQPSRLKIKRHHIKARLSKPKTAGPPAKAIAIANSIAAAHSEEHVSGTIHLSYVLDPNNADSPTPATRVRPGSKIQITDFPGGAKTFRITAVDADYTGVTLTVGHKPNKLDEIVRIHRRLPYEEA